MFQGKGKIDGMKEEKEENVIVHPPGIEPRASAWKALMLPLHHRCCLLMSVFCYNHKFLVNAKPLFLFIFNLIMKLLDLSVHYLFQ